MKEVKDRAQLSALMEDGNVALYFSSVHCGVCNTMKPKMSKLFEKYGMELYEVSSIEFPEFAASHLVLTNPTILIFENGREVLREAGFINESALERYLNFYIQSLKES